MNILSNLDSEHVIAESIKVLSQGGLLIFPTETSYGIGADATNPDAVSKLLKYKQRPPGKAISIAVNSKDMASKYIEINNSAERIIDTFLPGPVTVVSKSLGSVDKRLESETGTLGIRIPNYKLLLDILSAFGKPITATSANISGGKTPYSIDDITKDLSNSKKELIGLVIDVGELPKNPPSTVIDTTTDDLKIYRQGRINPSQMTNEELRITNNVEETIQFGEELVKRIHVESKPTVILLNGELGAGKTHFTKGIAKGLDIEQMIKSPTYNYVSEYKVDNKYLFHFDSWRIQNKEDLNALDFHGWFKPGNTVVIEWPSVAMSLDEKFFDNLQYYYVDFIILDENKREIRVYKKN